MGIFQKIINWFSRKPQKPQPPAPPVPPVPPIVPPSPPTDPIEAIKARLFELHNKERAAYGKFLFIRDSKLDSAAQKHNDYMISRNNLTHNEPGRDIGRRVSEEGYRWKWVGENIAMGQTSPEEVMKGWMNSSGHRGNILSNNYINVGFGVGQDSRGTWWWTVDFGS